MVITCNMLGNLLDRTYGTYVPGLKSIRHIDKYRSMRVTKYDLKASDYVINCLTGLDSINRRSTVVKLYKTKKDTFFKYSKKNLEMIFNSSDEFKITLYVDDFFCVETILRKVLSDENAW